MGYKLDEEFRSQVYNIKLNSPARKSWPKPEIILKLLKDGHGVRQIMSELGCGYNVIRAYRKEDPDFNRDYEAILNSPLHKDRQEKVCKTNLKLDDPPTPKEKFLDHFGKTYKLEESRRFSGLDAREVESFLDPNSDVFDHEFAEAFEEVKVRRKWALDDEMFESRSQKSILTTLVEAEMPEKYKQNPIKIENVLSLGYTEGGERAAVKLLNQLFGTGKNEDTNQPVIDVRPSEQPQRLLGASTETSGS